VVRVGGMISVVHIAGKPIKFKTSPITSGRTNHLETGDKGSRSDYTDAVLVSILRMFMTA
jgi:hypothetical protein